MWSGNAKARRERTQAVLATLRLNIIVSTWKLAAQYVLLPNLVALWWPRLKHTLSSERAHTNQTFTAHDIAQITQRTRERNNNNNKEEGKKHPTDKSEMAPHVKSAHKIFTFCIIMCECAVCERDLKLCETESSRKTKDNYAVACVYVWESQFFAWLLFLQVWVCAIIDAQWHYFD